MTSKHRQMTRKEMETRLIALEDAVDSQLSASVAAVLAKATENGLARIEQQVMDVVNATEHLFTALQEVLTEEQQEEFFAKLRSLKLETKPNDKS